MEQVPACVPCSLNLARALEVTGGAQFDPSNYAKNPVQARPGHFMRAAGGDLFAGLAAWLSSIVEKAMDRLCHTVDYTTTSSYGAQ